MSLFTTKDKITLLKEKSSNAIGIFQKTVSDLTSINLEIESEQKSVADEIAILKQKEDVLKKQKQDNESFINNINQFLGLNNIPE